MPDYNPWGTPIFPGASAFGIGSPAEEAQRQPTIVDNLLSHIAGAIGRGFMAPGQALQSTTPITSEQMIAPAQDMSTMMSTGSGAFPASANELRMGIKAYHGSPHDFDAFDLSKIGTGEGAQAYGHGLYFAENEGTAKSYRDALAGSALNPERNAQLSALAKEMRQYEVPGQWGKYSDPRGYELKRQYNAILDERAADKGKMYEVNINAEPEHFLDWDKPLSQQHLKVQEAATQLAGQRMNDLVEAQKSFGITNPHDTLTGQELYRGLANPQQLNQAGIPGIKYLDQGSRPPSAAELSKAKSVLAGAEMNGDPAWIAKQQANVARLEALMAKPPTSNYVVFNDKLIDIMRKYAIPGMLGAPIFANSIGENKQ